MKKVDELAQQVMTLLQDRKAALTVAEIADALNLRGNVKKKLEKSIHDLTHSGQIVKIRDNRYTVGATADLVTGTMQVLRSGHAVVTDGKQTAFVPSSEQGTALPGDRVLVRLSTEPKRDRPGMINGTVIRIVERTRHEIVGTLRKRGQFLVVVPVDPTYGRDLYVPDAKGAQLNDRVLCRFTGWETKYDNPEGEILESLGSADDPSIDTLAIIKHYDLPESFPPEVLLEAETVSGLMEKQGQRRDCRSLVTFTIDPVRARDFDDALSLEPMEDGSMELGVHIADVSHFVQIGGELDKEAILRGNSVYLPDKVIPMLPEQLSNGICSLRPNEDRLAFSVFMTVSASGEITASRFAKSVICSQARLTYEQAMAVINGNPGPEAPEPVRTRIVALHELAQRLRRNRFARYALDLDMPECEIVMGPDGMIADVRVVVNDASHQLVEECMVAANEAVARELTVRGVPLISRLHEPPRTEKIEDLQIQLQEMGLRPGDLNNPRNLSDFLSKVQDEPLVMHIRMAVLRSLNRALYSAEKGGHFGLAKQYYAHFTSPIRRYADLVVHRQLEGLLGRSEQDAPPAGGRKSSKRVPYSRDDLVPLAENCSRTEQVADEAERALEEIKKYRYLEQQSKSRTPREFEAVVVAVMNFGVFVELVHFQIQGLVHVSTLSDQFLRFDGATKSLRDGKKDFRVGSRMQVIAARVDFDKRQIDFSPVSSKPREGQGGQRERGGRSGREERGQGGGGGQREGRAQGPGPGSKPGQGGGREGREGRGGGGRRRRR